MKRWRAPNNPTRPARQIWRALFPTEPWPKRWRVQWAGFMRGAAGLTVWRERRILLSHGDARRSIRDSRFIGPVAVLVHEFVHVRCPRLRHGKEFTRLETSLLARLGLNKEGAS